MMPGDENHSWRVVMPCWFRTGEIGIAPRGSRGAGGAEADTGAWVQQVKGAQMALGCQGCQDGRQGGWQGR